MRSLKLVVIERLSVRFRLFVFRVNDDCAMVDVSETTADFEAGYICTPLILNVDGYQKGGMA